MQGRPVNLDLLRRTTRADFYAQIGVSELEALYPQLAMKVESDSDQETYAFFGAIIKPRRVDVGAGGGQAVENTPFKDYSMSLKNATWISLQEIQRDIIEDAKLDQISNRAKSMADSGVSFMDERMSAVIEANGNAYDGVAYFAASHHGVTATGKDSDLTSADDSTLGPGGAAAAGNPTVTDCENAVSACFRRLRSYTDDQGRIANSGNLGLVFLVPPGMERGFRAVLEQGPVAGQTGNSGVFKGRGNVAINPYSTSGTQGYAFVTTKPTRGIVYQEREPWEFLFITDGDDWAKRDTGALKGRARFDFLLGDWKKAVRFTFS